MSAVSAPVVLDQEMKDSVRVFLRSQALSNTIQDEEKEAVELWTSRADELADSNGAIALGFALATDIRFRAEDQRLDLDLVVRRLERHMENLAFNQQIDDLENLGQERDEGEEELLEDLEKEREMFWSLLGNLGGTDLDSE